MNEIAKKHRDQLSRIKSNIENSYEYFEDNYKRYTEFMNYVFVTTLTPDETALLDDLRKPIIEFNILEAYISRLRGEFSKNVPAVSVYLKDGYSLDYNVVKVIEGHVRYILNDANKDNLEYKCYSDSLGGGFSGMKVFTEYTGEMSFHQDIKLRRVYDPTLTGFDPLAERSDKTDGNYCFEIYPKRKSDFSNEYPDLKLDGVKFTRELLGVDGSTLTDFNWSFKTNKGDILLLADYYEKKKIKKKIVMLSNGNVMTQDEYNDFVKDWEEKGIIPQPPAIVGKPRTTEITKIVRYTVMENQVISYEETDHKRLPIVFVDGNSILTKENNVGSVRQITRPYVYHALGAQKLKNFCGQTLANEIENMGPSKMIASLESIPDDYVDAYNNPQETHMYIYNAFKDGDPNIPLTPPQMIPRTQIPNEISATFAATDSMVQNILGSFDATMSKITEQQVSGRAIQESTTLSNASAMPYVVSFMNALQSASQMIVDLIPLYYKTPRTIPVMDSMGNKTYVKINQDGGIYFDYDHDALQVCVEPDVSFSMQQSKALQQIIALMNSSPMFAQFINEEGLDIVLDNVEIRNIDELRERAKQYKQKQDMLKEQAQQMAANQPNPEQQAIEVAQQQVQNEAQISMAKLQTQAATEQAKAQLKAEEIQLEREKNQMELIKILSDIRNKQDKLLVEQQKVRDKRVENLVDAELKASEIRSEEASREMDKAIDALETLTKESEPLVEVEMIREE